MQHANHQTLIDYYSYMLEKLTAELYNRVLQSSLYAAIATDKWAMWSTALCIPRQVQIHSQLTNVDGGVGEGAHAPGNNYSYSVMVHDWMCSYLYAHLCSYIIGKVRISILYPLILLELCVTTTCRTHYYHTSSSESEVRYRTEKSCCGGYHSVEGRCKRRL